MPAAADVPVEAPVAGPSRVTRLMCAAAHLDGTFANHAARMLTREGHEAVAPQHGVDVVTLAHHVAAARARRRRRDRELAAAFAVTVLGYAGPVALSRLTGIRSGWWALVPTVLAAAGLALAWWIVWRHYREIYERARAVAGDDPDALEGLDSPYVVPPRTQWLQRLLNASPWTRWLQPRQPAIPRMEALAGANAVVYADDPFLDGGAHVDLVKQRVDLGDAVRPGRWDTHEEVRRRLLLDLHARLLERVPAAAPGRVDACSRIHVWGGIVADFDAWVAEHYGIEASPPLVDLQDEYRRPGPLADPRILEAALVAPNDWARTYACFQQDVRSGQIVVTSYVRLHIEDGELFAELVARVMPPLASGFHNVEVAVGSWQRERWRLARQAAAAVPGLLAASPYRLWVLVKDPVVQWRRRFAFRRRRLSGRPVNYGATSSLRADSATSLDALAHNQWVDVRRAVDGLQVQILDTLVALLAERGVDVDRLERDVERLRRDRSIGVNRTIGSVFDLGRGDLAHVG